MCMFCFPSHSLHLEAAYWVSPWLHARLSGGISVLPLMMREAMPVCVANFVPFLPVTSLSVVFTYCICLPRICLPLAFPCRQITGMLNGNIHNDYAGTHLIWSKTKLT